MDFDGLAIFTETAAAGSLAAAARRLHVTPMAASRALAALEQELGVRLMHRTTRALALTDEGQVFLPHALALLEAREAAIASVQPGHEGASGLLRLSCSAMFARKIVNPLLERFMAENPRVAVELMAVDHVVDMVAEGIDLSIRIAVLPDSNLVARRLVDNPCLLVASPAYLARHGRPRVLADLKNHQCLSTPARPHWTFEADGRKTRVKAQGRYVTNAIEAIHQASVFGFGLAVLSAWNVAEEVERGVLEAVTLEDAEPETLAIWAVYPTRRLVPAKVRLFIEALSGHLRG
ncbi:LysR family transcriptional regulator [Azorhizobium oxalatiphilum]|uniref:LysR family transcriptional regulator n=1 Tax=Azorhizobium oxalatiphilum TaxID=980631 RepID=A0A917CEB6_9HYPH|nr:LysR family transcriptional regulator [Azorhizobium oxalatiphilum]GGF86307.1 LysR family transcriptional regulator [Azorhizobium oxalatiphilum]